MPVSFTGKVGDQYDFLIVERRPGDERDVVRTFSLSPVGTNRLERSSDIRKNGRQFDTTLFYVGDPGFWLCFDHTMMPNDEMNGVWEDVLPPYIWNTDHRPDLQLSKLARDGVIILESKRNPHVVCPRCGKEARCYWSDGAAAADDHFDRYTIACPDCGFRDHTLHHGGNTTQEEWHTLCPWCNRTAGEHRNLGSAEVCPKCGAIDFFRCASLPNTLQGPGYTDSFEHTCKECRTVISQPCRSVCTDAGDDPDEFCPTCGRIVCTHS